MELFNVFVIMAMMLETVESYCSSTQLSAMTYSQSKTVYSSNYDYCTISIRPSSSYSYGSYYLKIEWTRFNVKGYMPDCNEDSIEVYLTGSYKSIGRYCSSNSGTPFKMYAHDGYAKIRYQSNGKDNGYFTFKYVLQHKTYNYLGDGSISQTACPNTYNTYRSREIYSLGWPLKYYSSMTPCKHVINRMYGNAVKIVFMDLGMVLYSNDCIKLSGSNVSYYYSSTIASSICYSSRPRSYISYDRYVQIQFNRQGGSSSNRGFLAGYITYDADKKAVNKDAPPSTETSSSNFVSSTLLRILIPGVVFFVVVAIFFKYRSRLRRNTAATNGIAIPLSQPTTTITTTNQTNTQEGGTGDRTLNQNAYTAFPSSTYPTSTYPTATYPTATYPTSTYPTSTYPTSTYPTSTYPTSTYPTSNYPPANEGYAPPAYGHATNPLPSSNTQEAVPASTNAQNHPYLPGSQQNPAGNQGYPAGSGQPVQGDTALPTGTSASQEPPSATTGMAFASHGGYYNPSNIPPVEPNLGLPGVPPPAYPDVPPPAYNSAI